MPRTSASNTRRAGRRQAAEIFHAFSREYNVRPCPYQPQQTIVVGSDFNVDPMAWVLGHRFADRLESFNEVFLRNSNTLETLNVVWQRYQDHRGGWEFYGDASASQRNTAAAASDYVQIANDERFKRAGRTMHYLRDNPAIEDRFSACNALLRNAAGQRRMFVDPHCRTCSPTSSSAATGPGPASRPTFFSAAGRWATLPTPWATPSTTSSPSSSGWTSRYR